MQFQDGIVMTWNMAHNDVYKHFHNCAQLLTSSEFLYHSHIEYEAKFRNSQYLQIIINNTQ